MGSNPENMIKKAISQTIVEEMLRDLGFYVLRMGQEDTANPLTQLEWFIKKCGGNFKLQKSGKGEYSKIDYLKKMPDFCVVNKDGDTFFLEVKFSKGNMLNAEQIGVFDFYPETYILIVNLEVGENVLFIKKGEGIEKVKEANIEHLKNSRFNLLYNEYGEDGQETGYLTTSTLKDWLKESFDIDNGDVITKYESLVKKWLYHLQKDKNYIDNLCNQKLVDNVFIIHIKERHNSLKEDIEEIELLFKNCWYNFNNILERKKEIEDSIGLNPSLPEKLKEVRELISPDVDIFKIKYDAIWEDIIIFEFHSFLANTMRTINFLVKFNLKNKEVKNSGRWETIGKFLSNLNNKEVFYFNKLKEEFDNWIKDVNDKRGDITHKVAEKNMTGSLSVKAEWDRDGNAILIKKIKIENMGIEDLEEYCQDKLEKLKNFIESYFRVFN